MANPTPTRSKLTSALIALVVVDVLAIVVWFSPLVGSEKARLDELNGLRVQLLQKHQQVNQLGDIDKKIVLASKQIDTFYKERLANRDSAVSANLGKLASETGVQLDQVKYSASEKGGTADLRPIEVDATLTGDYRQLARFLNSLERSSLFFIVDSVDLGGGQNNAVKLQIKLRSFLRTGA